MDKYKQLTFDEMADLHELGVRGFDVDVGGYGFWKSSVHNERSTEKVRAARNNDLKAIYRVAVE